MKALLRSFLALSLAWVVPAGSGPAHGAEAPYWLKFGKPAHTCPSDDVPFKVQGASWGVLASGIVLCHQTPRSYVYTLLFINVFVDPADKQAITRDVLNFDWCGLALYRPNAAGDDIDWRYEHAVPIKGALQRDSTGKIVFGNIAFEVAKTDADAATNMLFYITFEGPMVVIGVL